jgi:uncharacterized membrane protein YgcG
VFLANALLTSDNSNDSPLRELLVGALVPAVLPFLQCGDVDLREGTLRLLISLASTRPGKGRLQAPVHSEALEEGLRLRRSCEVVDESFREQEDHEQELVGELRAAIVGPVTISSNYISSSGARSNSSSSSAVGSSGSGNGVGSSSGGGGSTDAGAGQLPPVPAPESDETPTPVLLLQPPALTAASAAP